MSLQSSASLGSLQFNPAEGRGTSSLPRDGPATAGCTFQPTPPRALPPVPLFQPKGRSLDLGQDSQNIGVSGASVEWSRETPAPGPREAVPWKTAEPSAQETKQESLGAHGEGSGVLLASTESPKVCLIPPTHQPVPLWEGKPVRPEVHRLTNVIHWPSYLSAYPPWKPAW